MKRSITGAIVVAVAVMVTGTFLMVQQANAQRVLTLDGFGASIGVTVREVTAADAEKAKIGQPAGVVIESVQSGTPAEKAGFQSGDIVLEFDGERVRGVRHFTRLVQESPADRTARAVVVRGTSRQTLDVVPAGDSSFELFSRQVRPQLRSRELPQLPQNFNFNFDGRNFLFRRDGATLGVTVVPLTDQLASYFGVKEGALVSSVGDNSPASQAGLRAGDVITAVNGRTIRSAADVNEAMRRVQQGDGVDLTVIRDRKTLMLKATIPARETPSGRRGLPV